jgi:hypothetical protein
VNFLGILENDFKKWYGEFADEFKKVFQETAEISKAALPVVQEISLIVGAIVPQAALPADVFTKLMTLLSISVKDTTAVASFTQQYQDAPVPAALHALAAVIIKNLPVGAKATASAIDTAVQNAYSVSKLLPAVAK